MYNWEDLNPVALQQFLQINTFSLFKQGYQTTYMYVKLCLKLERTYERMISNVKKKLQNTEATLN